MPLAAGTRLDSFEIVAPLGAGGMGAVYRARDIVLKRDVAIKVLPENWTRDPARLLRFEQEAQASAALNHPNIISIFHIGQFDGSPYIVTELLEGETLRDRLHHGPMRLRELLDFGAQLAQGLAAAHDAGIIHRDLKPENIFLTKDGRLKILDFGLAKLDPEKSPSTDGSTVTLRPHTEAGHVMGTVGYMSPEQVRGLPADARSDIFAVGTILYEMATGQRAFKKATSADTMAAVLNEDPPPVSHVVANVPPGLQRIIHRCVSKSPDQRFQHASDLAFALEALSESGSTSVRPFTQKSGTSTKQKVLWPLVALVLVAVGPIAYWMTRPEAVPTVEAITQITDDGKAKGVFNSLQTDGSRLYFNEGRRGDLQIAQVAVKGGPVSIIPTPLVDPQPCGVAPDGSFLSVLQGGAAPPGHPLWKVPLPTGDPVRVGNLKGQDATVTPDGRIMVGSGGDLYIVDPDGSNLRKLISGMDGFVGNPAMSPDGKQIAFSFYRIGMGGVAIYLASSDGSSVRKLAENYYGFCCPAWTPDGRYLLFETRAKVMQELWYLPMQRSWWQRRVEPKKLTALPLSLHDATPNPRDGKTIFALGTKERGELVRYDAKTKQFVPFMGGISGTDVVFSRDGKWAAYNAFPELTLWRSRADGSDRMQLSYSMVGEDKGFSPNGNVAFNPFGENMSMVSMEGGQATAIPNPIPGEGGAYFIDWSPDGSRLVFVTTSPKAFGTINLLDLATGKRVFLSKWQDFWGVRWIGADKLVAALNSRLGFKLLDQKTQTWSDWAIEPHPSAISQWGVSPDHQFLYYSTSGTDPQLMRVRIGQNQAEPVVSLKDFHFAMFIQFNGVDQWISFAPDGSPVLTRDTGSQEIYALTVNWP